MPAGFAIRSMVLGTIVEAIWAGVCDEQGPNSEVVTIGAEDRRKGHAHERERGRGAATLSSFWQEKRREGARGDGTSS